MAQVCPQFGTPIYVGGTDMENKRKTSSQTIKRITRLEDGFLTLVQLSRVLSEEADDLRNRLDNLEAYKSGQACQCLQEGA